MMHTQKLSYSHYQGTRLRLTRQVLVSLTLLICVVCSPSLVPSSPSSYSFFSAKTFAQLLRTHERPSFDGNSGKIKSSFSFGPIAVAAATETSASPADSLHPEQENVAVRDSGSPDHVIIEIRDQEEEDHCPLCLRKILSAKACDITSDSLTEEDQLILLNLLQAEVDEEPDTIVSTLLDDDEESVERWAHLREEIKKQARAIVRLGCSCSKNNRAHRLCMLLHEVKQREENSGYLRRNRGGAYELVADENIKRCVCPECEDALRETLPADFEPAWYSQVLRREEAEQSESREVGPSDGASVVGEMDQESTAVLLPPHRSIATPEERLRRYRRRRRTERLRACLHGLTGVVRRYGMNVVWGAIFCDIAYRVGCSILELTDLTEGDYYER